MSEYIGKSEGKSAPGNKPVLAANGNKNAGDSDDYEDDHDENDEFVILVGLYEGLIAATYNAAVTNTVISALKELKLNG
uniref:Uncharacterized protein n=1 Tax=Glossina palpalis gambiensis TaxID=67801 RepID=A0A1B0C4T5_9MUSC